MNIRKMFGIAALASFIAAPAFAADMPLKAPMPAPTPACVWCGWYVGLNVGYSWGRARDNVNFVPTGFGPSLIATDVTHPNGVIGGGQAGYNWQTGNVVFGLETDIQGSGERGTSTVAGLAATCGVPCSVTETDRIQWFGTTRGRIGVTAGNSWLFYVTGGAAYGGIRTSGTENFVGGPVAALGLTTATTTRGGWTAGGGVEGQLTGKWTWKVEYLYMDFGTINYAFAEPPPLAPGNVTQALRVTDSVVRGGVNLHF
jgi:outer membrane immunogenic protein